MKLKRQVKTQIFPYKVIFLHETFTAFSITCLWFEQITVTLDKKKNVFEVNEGFRK